MKLGVASAYYARVRRPVVTACQDAGYSAGVTGLSTRWAPAGAHAGLADAAESAEHEAARDQVMWKREMPELPRA